MLDPVCEPKPWLSVFPASLQNSTYAQRLLTHAQELYTFAVNASDGMQTYQTALAYPSSGYGDDLIMAALLVRATNSGEYYSQVESYYKKYPLSGQDAVFSWDSKTPGLAVLSAQLANAGASFAAICSAGRRSPRGTFIESWMGQALPPSKPRVPV